MTGTVVKHAALIAFSAAGFEVAARIAAALSASAEGVASGECAQSQKAACPGASGKHARAIAWSCSLSKGFGPEKVSHRQWAQAQFPLCDALIFAGSTGIAVRTIAPHIAHKTTDPAVLVVDEGASWCIALLSGHLGGANRLAQTVGAAVGATPVITTATDVNACWAVDVWAASNHLHVVNPPAIKTVSARLLRGEGVALYSPLPIAGCAPEGVRLVGDPQEAQVVIHSDALDDKAAWGLQPKAAEETARLHLVVGSIAAGVGCRKGTPAEAIEHALDRAFSQSGANPLALRELCSIDLKADEPGLLETARHRQVPFVVLSAQELEKVEGSQSSSAFVQDVTGVDCVCERSALAAHGQLILPKQVYDKVTVALASVAPELAW